MTPRFDEGDEVVVVGDQSDFRGQWGRIKEYQEWCDRYFVELPDVSDDQRFAYQEDELELLTDEEEEPEDADEEESLEVPALGMSVEAFESYLEFLLTRTLSKVGTVGPREAFFGFQEFEGKEPNEILFDLLDKIEESMAMHAQLHILVARIGTALNSMTRENDDQD